MAETIVRSLNIIEINVNSIIRLSRRYDLCNFLNKHNPDIVLLNETKLNIRNKITFKDYSLVRKDRDNAERGGGTAILLKNYIKYKNYTNKTIKSFKCLEACIVTIPMAANRRLFLISAYYPSGNNDQHLKTELQQLFQSLNLQNPNNYYLLSGDLNCKHSDWGNTSNNSKGNILKEWISHNEIDFRCSLYASLSPSYPRCSSYLDLCIADSRLCISKEINSINCLKNLDYDSDHTAIQILVLNHGKDHPIGYFKKMPDPTFNFKKQIGRNLKDV